MKTEKLDKWGYPIHPEMNFLKPQGDFETRIALVIAFSLIIIGIIIGCAVDIEEYPPKWVIASTYLPKMEGYRNAGFFELDKIIYSHYCDRHGNMVRIKFNEEKKSWEKYKYETFGCLESKG